MKTLLFRLAKRKRKRRIIKSLSKGVANEKFESLNMSFVDVEVTMKLYPSMRIVIIAGHRSERKKEVANDSFGQVQDSNIADRKRKEQRSRK